MDALTEADPRTVGEFRLLARLGAGGMGRVFLASSLAGRPVAVKVIHPDLSRDSDFVRRFRNEVQAAQKVSGWYTAPVVAAGVDDHPPWLATAFVAGLSLEDIVDRYGPLPVAAVWRLAAGLAEALRAVHATGLVHRDLKPANVLLALDGPRVIDFGISRAVADTRLTATGAVIGTPSYMSPEQVEARETGPASDTFSLGSVLAFAASGVAPFRVNAGGSSAAVMYRVVHGEPELGALPEELRAMIAACLNKDERQRPDLGQIAAYSTTAAERFGLSPAAFWPPEVARVLHAQQDALTAQIEALQLAPAGAAPADSGAYGGSAYSNNSAYSGSPAYSGVSASTGAPAAPGLTGGPGAALTTAPGRGASLDRGMGLAPRGTSRRGLLIGAGVGGVAVVGGALGWVLSDRSPGTATAVGSGAGTGGGSTVVPTSSSMEKYYGAGARRTAAWRFRTGNSVDANPGAGGGLAYVGSSDNNLYAVSLATGKKAWSFPVASVTAAPEVVGGVVCLANSDGHFYALDAASGKQAWTVSSAVISISKRSWASAGSQVIVARSDAAAQAYDAATGTKGPSFATQMPYVTTLTAAAGVLYALDSGGILYAFRIASGAELWRRQLLSGSSSDTPGTSLAVADGSLYLGSTSGTVYAVGAAAGRLRWTYHPGSGLDADLAVSAGVVYLKDNNGTMHAVSALTGKALWTRAGSQTGFYGLTAAGGQVYYTTALALQALDARTGNPTWAFSPAGNAELLSTPTVASDLVLIGSHDDSLYAIKA